MSDSRYTPELAEEILQRMSEGEPLRCAVTWAYRRAQSVAGTVMIVMVLLPVMKPRAE